MPFTAELIGDLPLYACAEAGKDFKGIWRLNLKGEVISGCLQGVLPQSTLTLRTAKEDTMMAASLNGIVTISQVITKPS